MLIFLKKLYSQYKNIAKNSFHLSVVDGVKLLLPFIAMPYIIRVCGVENYGKIIFAHSVIAYFTIAVNFGLSIFTVRQVAKNCDDPEKLSRLASSFIALRLILIAICFAVLLILITFVPFLQSLKLLLLYNFISVLAEAFIMTAFFQGMEKMHNIAALQTVSVAFYLTTLFILVRDVKDYELIPLLQSTGLLISSLLGLLMLRFKYHIKIRIPKVMEIYQMFKGSIPFAMSRTASVINSNIAKIFVGAALGMHELAVLNIALKISSAAMLPINIIDHAIYPHNAKKQDRAFATRTFFCILGLGIICALIMIAGTPYAVKFFGQGKLDDAIVITCILGIKVMISALNLYTGTPVLVAFGYVKPFTMSIVYTMLFSLIIYPAFYFCGILSLNMVIFIIIFDKAFILTYRLYHCLKHRLLFAK